MKVCNVKVLRGPNIWSVSKKQFLQFDLEFTLLEDTLCRTGRKFETAGRDCPLLSKIPTALCPADAVGMLALELQRSIGMGTGMVVVIDGSQIKCTNISEAEEGEPVYVENLIVDLLVNNCLFNLETHEMELA